MDFQKKVGVSEPVLHRLSHLKHKKRRVFRLKHNHIISKLNRSALERSYCERKKRLRRL